MAQQVEGNHPTLLIDEDGNFNSKFLDDLKLAAVSRPVAVVSVFGVQSTGKSTLMNSLHSTKFKVMDASQGMHQTTKGIWVSKCPLPNGGHDILAIDTEGSDGSERKVFIEAGIKSQGTPVTIDKAHFAIQKLSRDTTSKMQKTEMLGDYKHKYDSYTAVSSKKFG
ncbi:protein ROOT HAIR DEFECTIVE 3 homolog 1-like [Coffea eugenioides]|uniref:protein ROOT HAIR DEFECTIVE 3 homolog 1-like n=1 Tax=Coffea eugenioides TaxID=49369 RepID=UPI000F60C5E6|nr:protein ROOT HAIR DEFECTIVE 3 homolog 1-like [Coffea eugenioides]